MVRACYTLPLLTPPSGGMSAGRRRSAKRNARRRGHWISPPRRGHTRSTPRMESGRRGGGRACRIREAAMQVTLWPERATTAASRWRSMYSSRRGTLAMMGRATSGMGMGGLTRCERWRRRAPRRGQGAPRRRWRTLYADAGRLTPPGGRGGPNAVCSARRRPRVAVHAQPVPRDRVASRDPGAALGLDVAQHAIEAGDAPGPADDAEM
jgi:hypothetical protein